LSGGAAVRIEHVAIWTQDLEGLKDFYVEYFGGQPNDKYVNEKTGFESYFLTFESGARLELMRMDSIPARRCDPIDQYQGLIHFAFSVGSQEAVDQLTKRLHEQGYLIVGEPRTTGDGYYESVALDPDGNRIEITI
jgi:lactoylglutathione lyase